MLYFEKRRHLLRVTALIKRPQLEFFSKYILDINIIFDGHANLHVHDQIQLLVDSVELLLQSSDSGGLKYHVVYLFHVVLQGSILFKIDSECA